MGFFKVKMKKLAHETKELLVPVIMSPQWGPMTCENRTEAMDRVKEQWNWLDSICIQCGDEGQEAGQKTFQKN